MSREALAHQLSYVDRRLAAWAEWSASRDDGGGHYTQVRYREPEIRGNVGDVLCPVLGDEPIHTEWAVGLLLKEHRRLGLIVLDTWRWHPGWSASMLATLHGISERTYWRHLERARLKLHLTFLDQAAGVVRQVVGPAAAWTGQGAPG